MKKTNTKSFAFQLASKEKTDKSRTDTGRKWQIRDGVAVAGCTGPNERYSTVRNNDGGVYC